MDSSQLGAELRDYHGGPKVTLMTPRYTFRSKEAIERKEAQNRVLVDEMGSVWVR